MIRRRTPILAGAVVVALAATTGVGLSGANFSAQTANPGNSFTAAATFPNMRVVTGTYSGSNSTTRSITGLGFQPDLVIVKSSATQTAVYRTSTMSGDASKPVSATALTANLIKSLDADGFTVGNDPRVNLGPPGPPDFYWTAFKASDGVMKLGSYTGNGAASRSITGAGFSPEYAVVLGAGAQDPTQRITGMTRSFRLDSGTGVTDGITALNADGFSVGANAQVNTNGTVYHYILWNEAANQVKVNSWTGDGSASRSITGVGFAPYYTVVRANDTVTSRNGAHKPRSLSGTSSLRYDAAVNDTTAITSLDSDGFQVGSSGSTNASGVTYHSVSFRDGNGACSVAGGSTQFGLVAKDAYVDQASPTSNFGTATDLRVRSSSGANRRTLVQYSLPTAPLGCSVTSAQLYMYLNSGVTGRTLEAYRADASWTETGVTWNNQPGTTGTASTLASSATAGYKFWDVTSAVQGLYSGDPNNGFVVRDQTEGAATAAEQVYSSSTGANLPLLVVTFG
ncbi:MAG TPA: DNRLRE domain-containing protein [Solirubrobacterales bacterium]|nr:DNRLRE domain-containing protein [Solirubrobacterales bacterium]